MIYEHIIVIMQWNFGTIQYYHFSLYNNVHKTECFVFCRLCYVNTLGPHEGPVSIVAVSSTLGDIAVLCKARKEDDATPSTEGKGSCLDLKFFCTFVVCTRYIVLLIFFF